MQPHIITDKGQVSFWKGMFKPTREQLLEEYKKLGKSAEQIFPLTFLSEVNIDSKAIEGRLTGFLFYKDIRDKVVEEIR